MAAEGLSQLPEKLDRIEQSEPIALDSVNFDFQNDPEYLHHEYGQIFHTIGRVEHDVPHNIRQIRTLLHFVEPAIGRFLGLWEKQEVRHGDILDEAQRRVGVDPYEPLQDQKLGWQIQLGGFLSHLPQLRRVVAMVYLVRGAQHERLTGQVYRSLYEKLLADGEKEFAHTAIQQIRPQEGGHFDFYRTAAVEKWQQMSPREQRLARFVCHKTYEPVGGGSPQQRAELGIVTSRLGITDMHSFSQPVLDVTRQLLGEGIDTDHIVTSLQQCADMAA